MYGLFVQGTTTTTDAHRPRVDGAFPPADRERVRGLAAERPCRRRGELPRSGILYG
jgi:hypothetical protein